MSKTGRLVIITRITRCGHVCHIRYFANTRRRNRIKAMKLIKYVLRFKQWEYPPLTDREILSLGFAAAWMANEVSE